MDGTKTAVERAFELASSGRFSSLPDIRRALASEGYSTTQVVGSQMTRQLRQLMVAAKGPPRPVEPKEGNAAWDSEFMPGSG